MDTEFAFLQLSRDELVELHRATLARFIMEGNLRRENGLEPIDLPPLLIKLESLLNVDEQEAAKIFFQVDNEVWEHSWLVFTDEWAWFRARQDVRKRLGEPIDKQAYETLVEKRYRDHFERYIAELDMRERPSLARKKKPARQTRQSKA